MEEVIEDVQHSITPYLACPDLRVIKEPIRLFLRQMTPSLVSRISQWERKGVGRTLLSEKLCRGICQGKLMYQKKH